MIKQYLIGIFLALLSLTTPAMADWQVVTNLPFTDPTETVQTFDGVVYCTTYNGRVYYRVPSTELFTEMGQGQFHNGGVQSLAVSGDLALLSLMSWGGNWRNQRVDGQWGIWEQWPDQANSYSNLTFVDDLVFASQTNGLFVSDDLGMTWQPSSLPSTDSLDSVDYLDGVLLAHTGISFNNDPGGELFVSQDQGETWSNLSAEVDHAYLKEACSHNGSLFISLFFPGGLNWIFSSDNAGISWNQVPDVPNMSSYQTLVSSGSQLFVGGIPESSTVNSIYSSEDLLTWNRFTDGLSSYNIQVISMAFAEGKLFKTNGTTMMMTDLPDVSAADDEPFAWAQKYQLSNHPNPFNPRTTIIYNIPEGTRAPTLGIFDLSGRLIRKVSLSCQVSTGEFSWNGRDSAGREVPSGLYLVRLNDGARLLATHRMQLVR